MSSRMPLIDGRLLTDLADFFPSTCTIQDYTEANDAAHQPIKTWANLAAHIDLPCRKAPSKGDEFKRPDQTFATNVSIIEIAGYYDSIVETYRVVLDTDNYDILLVEHDGSSKLTRITAEIVT